MTVCPSAKSGLGALLFFAACACAHGGRCAQESEACIAADPEIAEAGGKVSLRIEGIDSEDLVLGTATWDLPAGEAVCNHALECTWTAPDRVGIFTARFTARGSSGEVIVAEKAVEVRRFGQPSSDGCTIPCNNIYRGYAKPDQVPVLDNPRILHAPGEDSLPEGYPVIGIDLAGEARAYPLHVLSYHEVINDSLGGKRITVTYSPLAGFAFVFSDGDPGGFGHSGMLYEGFHLVYDRSTRSLWLPVKLECVKGKLLGRKLDPVPFIRTTWGAWRELRPATSLALPEPENPEIVRYDLDPYDWYEKDHSRLVGRLTHHDLRLPRKERVIGLWHGGAARAYPIERLGRKAALNESLGGMRFVLLADSGSGTHVACGRRAGGILLDFDLAAGDGKNFRMKDRQTGSLWNIMGEAVSGPLAGRRLEPLYPYNGFFFAWAAFRQGSEIWKGE